MWECIYTSSLKTCLGDQLHLQAIVTFADMDYPFMAIHVEIVRRPSHSKPAKK